MFFGNQAMLDDLKKQDFELGIGGLNYADSLLFRNLGVEYLKVTEEDLESFTLQAKLKVPILTSTYPSSQIWSRFDYSTLPHFGSLEYRLPFFGLYQLNKYNYMNHTNAMKKIVGAQKAHLVDEYDQDHGMFIGQGTRAGLYQSIMMKPPNVRYVYPLTAARSEVALNSGMKNAVVVFNVEAEKNGLDMMACPANREKLINEIKYTSEKGVGVVVMTPPERTGEFEAALSKDVQIISTSAPHSIKLTGAGDLPMFWVASCTQNNFVSGMGEHKALFVGYAKGADKTDQNTQKFNCHKLAEFEVGLQIKEIEGMGKQIESLTQKGDTLVEETFGRVKFYSDLLQDERASSIDLEYWIDYIHEFGVEHKIPLYDHMSFIKYHNIDLWSAVALVLYIIWYLISSCVVCCCCSKKAAEKDKRD